MKVIGLIGLLSIVTCWIPQTIDVLRRKKVEMKLSFLILYFIGSISLTIYAIGDVIFLILNFLTAVGSAISLYYKLFPHEEKEILNQ
ncbi:MAG: PQ-loop domain-containing transporter [Candidatus Kryptoniota bacterium]